MPLSVVDNACSSNERCGPKQVVRSMHPRRELVPRTVQSCGCMVRTDVTKKISDGSCGGAGLGILEAQLAQGGQAAKGGLECGGLWGNQCGVTDWGLRSTVSHSAHATMHRPISKGLGNVVLEISV